MNKKFWEEYQENSLKLLSKALIIGIAVLIYSLIPDYLNCKKDNFHWILVVRGVALAYLLSIFGLLNVKKINLSHAYNYYIVIYSAFFVLLGSALAVGYLNEELTTYYYFGIIELELFYAILTLSKIRVFAFFVTLGNILYFLVVYLSGEIVSFTTISNLLSVILMAPLAVFIQYQLIEYHKKEYLKRLKLSIEINKKEHAQIRLIEAKKIAEKANNAKSIFIANLSHEVRTPIHAISNYSRLGLNKAESLTPERLSHYFTQINESSKRLLMLVDELLDFTKLESNAVNYNYQMNNLLTIIKKSILELKVLADKKDITIKINAQEKQNLAYFDEDKIMQVMLNLLANAIKFSPKESEIHINIEHTDDNLLLVKVVDSGIGVEKSELRTIFNDFVQGTRSYKANLYHNKKGTGLGLSISRRIILNHNGNIWILNNKEKGITVYFTLPRNTSN